MTHEMRPATETTPEGLKSLTEHIANIAAQGLLDPEFMRKLAKRIASEFQEVKATRLPGDSALAEVEASIETLLLAADLRYGARLTRSLQALREHESAVVGRETYANHPH